ncbi:MAG: hypothetical protein V3W34_14480 [Phycisphaerae bacterium]
MAKNKKKKEPADPAEAAARYSCSETDKAKARKWFARAGELANDKNWDYAVQCYVDGLGFWPEAVEEGHQPLRLAASERSIRGGKKPGFTETMKYTMTGKDAKKAMLNAEWLLSHAPRNISYMEGILKNANKLHCEETLEWIGPIYSNAAESEKKLNPKRFALLRGVNEDAGNRASDRGESALAVQFYERAAEALQLQSQADPKDLSLENELRDLSTKLTILKGKYESASTFTESMRDAEEQRLIHDQDRMFQADDSMQELIAAAQKDLAANPDNPGKVETLVELLCRRENEADENRALSILVDKYKAYRDYRFKMRAEDIRSKQMRRTWRAARESGDGQKAKELQIELLKFDINAYRERVQQYPTDNKFKFEYGLRLFQARKFDDAIPQFQAARAAPKIRMRAELSLGRCFYEKRFFAQASGTLSQAVNSYDIPDDALAKDLRYWLARSMEAEKRLDAARDTYGEILQLDYNFRDVRDRLQALTAGETPSES